MTVRNTYSDSLATAQAAWLEAEYRARAAFALLRLGSLDRLASQLTEADKFDAAYDVWDDYIDGRHADERTGSLDAADLAEQSTIFTRSLVYLGAKEGLALAQRAWGQQRFEVFTRSLDGTILGKLTYLGDPLRVTIALPGSTRTHALELATVQIKRGLFGSVSSNVLFDRLGSRLALHPVFGRADS